MYPSRSWVRKALVPPQGRAAYARLLDQGWTDPSRHMHADAPMYTCWGDLRGP